MTNIAVLVSGGGTNLQAIIDRIADGSLRACRVRVVISSKPRAYALERAKNAGIPGICVERRRYSSIDDYDAALLSVLKNYEIDLVITAGFLTIFGKSVVDEYPDRIINIHPALIPSFCGKGFYGLTPHVRALEYGVKVSGATTHFVSLEADAGPIIMQKAVEVEEGDTPESLQRRIMTQAEWVILPETIRLFAEGRLRVDGRIVTVLPPPADD